ncbi:DUF3800 domain-containing protein [Paludibacterium paludis]|uniref:3-deoxy-D-manno-octulosonic acid transferase n=1 Tax=Paludibacterium paludis TaxID=1225769 RepID=A0A918UB17_9NEIS|nr:DUF3800 domain-containing protein [Paludibacterium paludis]GGY19563.1 3-deoxy-D-manno-octulosonic acid transferase [Paludibacterium paludis]
MTAPDFSDYVVFVDESGDHSLTSVCERYPLFVLSFCLFRKRDYTEQLTPAIRRLKFTTFGHDLVVLHESELRRKQGPFARLSKAPREAFMTALTDLIRDAAFELFAVVIDKRRLREHGRDLHPYHLALEFGLEGLYLRLREHGQDGRLTHVICEARGAKEDAELHEEFRRLVGGDNGHACALPFALIVADKKTNSEGLQLADLTARPIGLSILRPEQANRAAEALLGKWYRRTGECPPGSGLRLFP